MASIPAGTIAAYAGPNLDGNAVKALATKGWLVCDGTPYGQTQYPDLYGVIGKTWGNPPESFQFLVPDLRGQFLRGSTAARAVADRQGYSTAAPSNAFQAKLYDNDTSKWKTYDDYTVIHIIGNQRVWHGDLGITVTSKPAGGDAETAPVHADIVWLISHSNEINGSPVAVPQRCVVSSMADVAPAAPWQVADGTSSMPDLRGLFLRGSGDGRATNTARIPYTTGWPVNPAPSKVTIQRAPVGDNSDWTGGANRHPLYGSSSASFIAYVGVSGGDAETRPANVAADALVATQDAPAVSAGAIIAYAAGSDPNTDAHLGTTTWLKCDGTPVSTDAWPDLAHALAWAVSGNNIQLPSLGDQFLRATDRGAHVDPGGRGGAMGSQQQGSTQPQATGKPQAGAWQIGCNVSDYEDSKSNAWGENQDVMIQNDTDEAGAATFNVALTGWDNETRPANVAIAFWICGKS
jgi:hypothetical protein